MKKLLIVLLLLAPTVAVSETATPNAQLDSYITLLRTDLKAQRAVLIVNNMHFLTLKLRLFGGCTTDTKKN